MPFPPPGGGLFPARESTGTRGLAVKFPLPAFRASWLLGRRPRGLMVGLVSAGAMIILSLAPYGDFLENRTLDLWYRWQPPPPVPEDLLIVAIDEPSFQELKLPWPWPRRLHAELIRRLDAAGARLIVLDIIFADPGPPEDDRALAEAIRQADKVVLSATFEIARDPRFSRRILITPLPALGQAARCQGLSTIIPDADGVVRRFRLTLGGLETLPLAAYRLLRPENPLPPPMTGLIHYAGPPRTLDTVSYYQVLDPERPLPAARIRGRVVLVGAVLEATVTPRSQADAFYTPYFAGTGRLMAGVEIQGHILNTLLQGSWGRELLLWQRLTLLAGVLVGASVSLSRLRPGPGFLLTAGAILLLLAASFAAFVVLRLWVPPFLLVAGLALAYSGNVLMHYLVESREKRWLRQAFSRYVSPEVVETIVAHPQRLELGGEEVEATVLFADLEGFTSLSEHMPPRQLIQLLNEYFTPMTEIVLAHQGMLDKYIGDALMALWGAPVPLADHALLGCRAALEMQRAMSRLQAVWGERGLPLLTARLGLHSGPVVAGNVGSRERFNYTVLGDTVNLASRLEGVNKVYGTRILLSETTARLVEGRLLLRELDRVQVKGRGQPLTIYELLGEYPPEGPPAWLECFARGLKAYREQKWEEASRNFLQVLQVKPEDRPAHIFAERCRSLALRPPPPDWMGVFVLEAK